MARVTHQQTPPSSHDIQICLPVINSRYQTQPQNPRHRAENGDIYLRYEAATTCRDDAQSRRCVCLATHADLDTNKTTAICALSTSADSSYLAGPSPEPLSNTPSDSNVSPFPCVDLTPKPVWRHSLVFHLANADPGAQSTQLLPLHQLYRVHPSHLLREMHRHPCMWHPGRGEALSV